MATIPMQVAQYVAAGETSSWRHYALNIPVYTHFTSPIRRYADVMVHRIITATLEGEDAVKKTYKVDAIAQTAEHCNGKRLAAKMAQERSDKVSEDGCVSGGQRVARGMPPRVCPIEGILLCEEAVDCM